MLFIAKKKVMSKVLTAALGAAGALAIANTANADTQVQVQSGDTVWGFAQQYSTTIDSITTANQLTDANVIYVGQQLVIPTSAISAASTAATTATSTAATTAASQATEQTVSPVATSDAQTQTATSTTLATSTEATNTNTVATSTAASQAPAQVATVNYTVNNTQATSAANNTNYTTLNTTNTSAATTNTASYTVQATASQQATTTTTTQAVSATPATQAAAGQGNGSTASAVATAQSMIGVPYVWSGNTPSGFDCSGLVQYAYGLSSSYRTTYQQANLGTHNYDIDNAQSGDLYFWGSDSAPYHVAIATGNGNYIQAPAPGQNVQTGNINWYTPSYYISMN